MKNNRTVGYVRISCDDQDVAAAAMDAQMVEIRRVANARGAYLAKVYVDARSNGAPEFEQRDLMLAEVVDINVDAVVVASLSRLARDPMQIRNIRQSLAAWRIDVIAADKEAMVSALRFLNPDR